VNAFTHRMASLWMRLFLAMSAIVAIAAAIVAGHRLSARRPAAQAAAQAAVAPVVAPEAFIAAEAQVFRTRSSMLAIGGVSVHSRDAHPRSLARYRYVRAYPGAPPRIPHGLTPDEFREGSCKACHERGGYSVRFNAYVPVTPHPEMGACLQCHVGDAQLMAIPLPDADPNSRCRQCHLAGGGGPRASDASLDWHPMMWPRLTRTQGDRTPPPIPHDSPFRVNCLACHASPSGVLEIQMRHPERAACRQCHLQSSTNEAQTAPFVRAPVASRGIE
jgi:cytochrome c-type protein NapB